MADSVKPFAVSIPPEVVDAAARAIVESLRTARLTLESEDMHRPEARAAICAALTAWPGADILNAKKASIGRVARHGRLILPLPQENSNE